MVTHDRFKLFNPDTMPKPTGYSQIAEVKGGRIVFIAGQVALDRSGNVIGKDDMRKQTNQVFQNLQLAVEAAGGSFRDIIRLSYFVVDLSRLSEIREVRDMFVDVNNPPVSTLVQVTRLFRPEFLIEVEAVAVVG